MPALVLALRNVQEREFVRRQIASALGRMGAEAVFGLVESLGDRNASVRYAAAVALAQIGPEAKAAVPALIKGLNDPANFVRAAAAVALKTIDPGQAAKAGLKKAVFQDLPIQYGPEMLDLRVFFARSG